MASAFRLALAGIGFLLLTQNGVRAEIRLMRVPDGGIQPQAAIGKDGTIHLIYFKGDAFGGDVYYARFASAADSWQDALKVNSLGETVVAAGTVRGAHLALGIDDRVHVAWMSAREGGADGKRAMYYARMKTDGSGFEPQRNVITHAYGLDGGGSVAADGEGNVYVVWHAGEAGEQSRRVYAARSDDGGETFSAEVAASDEIEGACGCCGIRAAAGVDGAGYVLYRTARRKCIETQT